MAIRLILADDHPIFRDGLVQSITETGEFEVLGVGESAEEAVALAAQHSPDIALLDLSMPGNGITAAKRIIEGGLAKHVAMLTVSEDDADVTKALQVGAIGYVLKGVSADDLRRILKGDRPRRGPCLARARRASAPDHAKAKGQERAQPN